MSKNERPQLSEDAAGKLLANVFDACGQEPNTIPLKKLASYTEYRKEKYSFQKVLLIVVLVVFLLLPLCFMTPKIDVVRTSPDTDKTQMYEITVSSRFMPVNSVTASVDGHGLIVYESGEKTYTVEPNRNGILRLKVTLFNRQYAVKDVVVDLVDVTSPALVENARVGDSLYLYLSDEESGINYGQVRAETLSGAEVLPTGFDEEKSLVIFDFPEESMNIFVPDYKGNTLQLVLTR